MRIVLILLGLLLALFGVACGASGLAAYRSVDSDGFVTGDGRLLTTTAAVVFDTDEFRKLDDDDESGVRSDTTLRIRAESADGQPVTVAVGRESAVEAFLQGGSATTIRDLDFGPFEYEQVNVGGGRPLPPAPEGVFAVIASGEGSQELRWRIEPGEWRALVMHADGSPGLDLQVEFGVKFPNLRGFAVAAMVVGSVCLALGLLLAVFQFRARRRQAASRREAAAISEE